MPVLSDLTRLALTTSIGLHTIVFASGCAVPDPDVEVSETEQQISVAGATGASCSTATVRGLSIQIAEEVECMSSSTTLARFEPGHGIHFTSNAVLPYLNAGARRDLLKVAASGVVRVNSGYRTVAQQYLLYRWFREGRCHIKVAAPPGTSNHESARAVDLSNWAAREGAMAHHGWAHDVPGDVVHFDHLSSPNLAGRDVKAFQRLWNRNHPHDHIATDGDFGPQTAARLRKAPAKGFAKGSTCHVKNRALDVRAIDGPDLVGPGSRAHYTLALANDSDADWPADAQLVTSTGAVIDVPVLAADEEATIELDIDAPLAALEGEPIERTVSLVAGGETLDAFAISATASAAPGAASAEGDDASDDGGDTGPVDDDGAVTHDDTAGCQTGGGLGWLALALPALVVRRRRSR